MLCVNDVRDVNYSNIRRFIDQMEAGGLTS
jgi:hypothetical protein